MLGRRILVRQQLSAKRELLVPPKTSASVREVPLSDETLEVLAGHMAEFPPVEVEVEDRTGPRPTRRTARLLFTMTAHTGQRGPVKRSGFEQTWNRAVRLARAAGADLPERITPHALRHTYVALMIAEGAHPKTIQAMLGHEKIGITLDVYGHLFPAAVENARAMIGTALRREESPALKSVRDER
jgi:integrase